MTTLKKEEKISIEKTVSEDTIIKIKPIHLYSFLSILIAILVTIFSFFYSMLNTTDSDLDAKIKEKVDKEFYELDKKYTTEGITDLKEMTQTTLTTVKNINEDVTKIKIKVGVIEATSNNSKPTTIQPNYK